DAALHALALVAGEGAEVSLPFAWSDAQLLATGASSLRVRFELESSGGLLEIADGAGQALAVARIQTRPATPADIRGALARSQSTSLYELRWTSVTVPEQRRRPDAIVGELTMPGVPSHNDMQALRGSDAPKLLVFDAMSHASTPLDATTSVLE